MTQVTRLAATLGLALTVACGSSTTLSGSAAVSATPAGVAATAATDTGAGGSGAASTATVAKVSANNATNEQLIAAFTAAGIPNPSSWAREVQEYRPYDTSDANLTKLRQNLVKYNPAAGVVDKIVATLSLP